MRTRVVIKREGESYSCYEKKRERERKRERTWQRQAYTIFYKKVIDFLFLIVILLNICYVISNIKRVN